MARSKEGKKDEYYLSEIRSLKKLVKSLRQRVKQLEKQERTIVDEIMDQEELVIEELPIGKENKIRCMSDSCGKGTYETIELLGKLYGTCNVCSHRTRIK